jgi:prepilin-type N-terminal cleavage/methylation domain-containing protein
MPVVDVRSDRGFTLVEVLVAAALLIVAAAGVAQLVAVAARANRIARGQAKTTMMAVEKMEQLRSLSWSYDESGGLRSDSSTDVSRVPATTGGAGLTATPAGSLERKVGGCVDYLNGAGQWVGTGTTPPVTAVYVRRWAVLPLEADPSHSRVLVVLAASLDEERELGTSPRPRLPQDTLLVALKTRQMGTP